MRTSGKHGENKVLKAEKRGLLEELMEEKDVETRIKRALQALEVPETLSG